MHTVSDDSTVRAKPRCQQWKPCFAVKYPRNLGIGAISPQCIPPQAHTHQPNTHITSEATPASELRPARLLGPPGRLCVAALGRRHAMGRGHAGHPRQLSDQPAPMRGHSAAHPLARSSVRAAGPTCSAAVGEQRPTTPWPCSSRGRAFKAHRDAGHTDAINRSKCGDSSSLGSPGAGSRPRSLRRRRSWPVQPDRDMIW